MTNNQFYTVKEEYRETFFKLPKVFFTSTEYDTLSLDAKVSYAILQDRLQLSISNDWFDNEGKIFFIYTNEELQNILKCGNKKVVKIKSELTNLGLLKQKRQGLNKPNLLYLLKPKVSDKDVYKTPKEPSESSNDKEVSKRHFQKCQNDTSRDVDMTHQEMSKEHTNKTDLNKTNFNENDINDMYDMYDTDEIKHSHTHSYHSNHSDTDFTNDALKYQLLHEFPNEIQNYLSNFTVEEINIIKQVILKAKKSFNNETFSYYRIEDIELELLKLLKVFKATLHKKNESVATMQGYLMTSIKNEFSELHSLHMRRKKMNENIFVQQH